MRTLDLNRTIWDQLYTAYGLILIGSKEENGSFNFAPKHMFSPAGWDNYFAFMGTPRKATFRNVEREKVFTVSYPRPSQLLITSLAASPREDDNSKLVLDALPTVEAVAIEGRMLADAYIHLECKLDQIVGQFGEWKMLVGKIVRASVSEEAHRHADVDDAERIFHAPIMSYVHPHRFAELKTTQHFPFPVDFKR